MDSGFPKKSGPSSSKVQVSLMRATLTPHKLISTACDEPTEFIHDSVQNLIFLFSLMFSNKIHCLEQTIVFAILGEIVSMQVFCKYAEMLPNIYRITCFKNLCTFKF
jgi:hypothetical protein